MEWSEPAVWREPPRGSTIDATVLALGGLDQLRAITGRPAMSHLTGTTFDSAGLGEATFSMPISGWLLSPQGLVPGGVLTLPADGALGCAIHSTLPAGTAYTTAELSITYLRRVPIGQRVTAAARTLHSGRRVAFSWCDITDEAGTLIAHASSRCHVFPLATTSVSGSGTGAPRLDDAGDTTPAIGPDPFERRPAGTVLDAATWNQLTGLEVLAAQVGGELPHPPLHHLLGVLPVSVSAGAAECVMPITGWLNTPWGWPQGGFLSLLADVSIGMAVQTTVPAGGSYANLDLKVNYLRPLVADGNTVRAVAAVVHRGRSLAVATAELTDSSGRRVALATGSVHVSGDRAANGRA